MSLQHPTLPATLPRRLQSIPVAHFTHTKPRQAVLWIATENNRYPAYPHFMASVDANEGERSNAAFAAEHNADFPILSDPNKETTSAYGVLSDRGFSNRWTFYIDKEGIIRFIDKEVNTRLATSAEFMAQKLGELGVAKCTSTPSHGKARKPRSLEDSLEID